MSMTWNRREILKAGAGVFVAARLPLRAESEGTAKRLLVHYRTDAASLARLVPPGLKAAKEPLVEVRFDWFAPATPDLLAPKPYGVAQISVAVEREGQPGWMPIGVYASNDRARLVAREGQGLPAEDAQIDFKTSGDAVEARIGRRGETLLSVEAALGEAANTPADAPTFVLVFTLEPDWRQGVVQDGSAGLWRIPEREAASAQAAEATVELPYASAGDPLSELPVSEVIGAWLTQPSAPQAPEKIADLDAAALAAWAPLRFDRPVERERFWMPAGWRTESTAYRLSEDEMVRYQQRKEILFDPLEVVEIDAMISSEAHEAMVPPFCRTAGRPMIKILGLRVGAGALSPVPYSEAWLFAFTITANRMAWYAVSHIVGEGGDLTFGRDVLGYPSKSGEVDIVTTPIDFSLSLKRMGREVCFADGTFHGFSTGTSLAQLPMAGLRARPGGKGAELVYQMWTFQGRRNRIDPAGFQMGFPNGAAPGLELKPDPWYEMGAAQPALLSVMENAVMQRAPAEVVGEAPGFEEFYRERCDGVLPWEERPANLVQPTLLARRGSGASS